MPFLGDHLATIETRFGQSIDRMYDTPESLVYKPAPHLWPAVLYPSQSRRGYYVPSAGVSEKTTVYAIVNEGRWMTQCPFCASAQEASQTDPFFYCARCQNEPVSNQSVPVAWPDDHAEVERLLVERPFRENRYWEPSEPVAQLVAENQSIDAAV